MDDDIEFLTGQAVCLRRLAQEAQNEVLRRKLLALAASYEDRASVLRQFDALCEAAD